MAVNKRLEIAGKAPEAANAEAGDNKMDQIRELMFGGGWKSTSPTIASSACAGR